MQLPGGLGPLHVVECGEEASVCFSCAWLTELILIRNGSLVRTYCFEDAGVSVNGVKWAVSVLGRSREREGGVGRYR